MKTAIHICSVQGCVCLAGAKRWAKELSAKCSVRQQALEWALEELSESCYGDSASSQQVIEELTLSCHLNEEELRKFVSDVAKSCPMDAKKLKEGVAQAQGNKERVYDAIDKAAKRPA